MDSYNELLQKEREQSLAKQRETVQAYERDVTGSFERAIKDADNNQSLNSKLSPSLKDRRDVDFVTKVKSIANVELNRQLNEEKKALNINYGVNKINAPIGKFTDIPVRILDGLGRDIGEKLAAVDNVVDELIPKSNLLDTDSSLSRGIDKTNKYIDAFSQDIKKITTESPWIAKAIKSLKDRANEPVKLKDVNSFFGGIDSVFSSHMRKTLGDLADILDEWWHDPRTLCCLIKILAALAVATVKQINNKSYDNSSFGKDYNKIRDKFFSGKHTFTELSGTKDFFDKLIAVLKLIREFLNTDLSFSLALNIDLGLAMSKASSGALMAFLSALQQMLEDKIYSQLMKWVQEYVRSEIRQCIPFEKLLRLISDFITGPDGMFKFIQQYIDAYMLGFSDNMRYGFNKASKVKMLDLAALDKLIALLEKMRDAMLNLELCIEADFSKTGAPGDDGGNAERSLGIGQGNFDELVNQIRGKNTDNITGNIIYPTDREIRAFIKNRLGESDSFADQVLTSAKASSELNVGSSAGSLGSSTGDPIADLNMAIGDCARTLNSTRLEELAKIMVDWELT